MRRRITTERQRQLAAMTSQVQESLSVSGILLGRSMGRSPALVEQFAGASGELADLEVRSQMAGKWQQSTISIAFAAIPAADLLAGWPRPGRWRPRGLHRHARRVHHPAELAVQPAERAAAHRGPDAELAGPVRRASSNTWTSRSTSRERRSPSSCPTVRGDVRLRGRELRVRAGRADADRRHARRAGRQHARRRRRRPARARPRSATCSPGCTTRTPARSPSTASTCATCPWPGWPGRSASSPRRRTCCTRRSRTTSASPSRTPPTRSWSRLPARPGSTT